jgi:hypothetical protein
MTGRRSQIRTERHGQASAHDRRLASARPSAFRFLGQAQRRGEVKRPSLGAAGRESVAVLIQQLEHLPPDGLAVGVRLDAHLVPRSLTSGQQGRCTAVAAALAQEPGGAGSPGGGRLGDRDVRAR